MYNWKSQLSNEKLVKWRGNCL